MGTSHSTPEGGSGKVVAALINARGVSDTTPATHTRSRRRRPPTSTRADARNLAPLPLSYLRALSMRVVCPHELFAPVSTARGRTERLLSLLYVKLFVLVAVIHDHFHNHAAAAMRTFSAGIELVVFDQTPLATRPPVPVKIIVGIIRVLLRVLFPVRIGAVDRVCLLVVLLLQSGEEFVDQSLFRPEPELVRENPQDEQRPYNRNDAELPPTGSSLVVFLRIHQCHRHLG